MHSNLSHRPGFKIESHCKWVSGITTTVPALQSLVRWMVFSHSQALLITEAFHDSQLPQTSEGQEHGGATLCTFLFESSLLGR